MMQSFLIITDFLPALALVVKIKNKKQKKNKDKKQNYRSKGIPLVEEILRQHGESVGWFYC